MKKKLISILSCAIIALALTGCGSDASKEATTAEKDTTATATKDAGTDSKAADENSKSTDDSSKDASQKQDTKVTYENFMNIKMGESYDQVVALLGQGEELSSSSVGDVKSTIYEWKSSGMGNLNVTVQNNAVIGKAQAFLKDPNAKITLDSYNKIQNGMTYDQVKAILGEGELTSEGKLMDYDTKLYSYINEDGSNANFTFSNDSMDSKAQLNLQ